jgi:Tol biopolymer transport system component
METPLIERRRLFGNPSRAGAHISPNGRWLSWLAPRGGVMNIWTAPATDPDTAQPVTNERVRPIRAYFWAPDSLQVLFINDQGGDENLSSMASLRTEERRARSRRSRRRRRRS